MKVAVVGAGWAGMAAAVQATRDGHHATVFEAARAVGGRARALNGTMPDGTPVVLDNGQHILIGAYSETLELMRTVGVDPQATLLRLPLTLLFPDGDGLALPDWPSPLDALAGIFRAHGWSAADKWSLLRAASGWQLSGFACAPQTSVADLCRTLTPTVLATMIDPLCVSALNTPAARASGQVFLTVLRDSLFGGRGSSNLLLPRVDLATLFPQAAADWLQAQGGVVQLGTRVERIAAQGTGWQVNGQAFDAVLWATSASNAALALVESARAAPETIATAMQSWATTTQALQFEAIATVYAHAAGASLSQPMLALRSDAAYPAQFVFDRGQLGGPAGLLAFVVSASEGDRDTLQTQVLAQAQAQLGLALTPLQTVVEKRATFACTPGLVRPAQAIAPGLWACGDYVDGPYPATLEGAVRSGVAAAASLRN
ncbi:hydroxysqualene dehydroxylase HpnE [Rhodoferax sp.]|uniref:hydroxysqualene dehydroxylase HpnE n=1 Tax=Rhodoferax sp. TaxID=50421 RepID=UPI002ACE06FA|nr:hydroxysqualene dehydroxylase HpnE [Rhodoferax sp.]MDZ7918468.1 hydroxysqualene dehydroxylase HpnE [Rhodoferax sp.]